MAQTTLRDYLQNTEDAISSGRIDEAMANCEHILSYFPESLDAQRLLGEVYLAQGYLEEAQQTFDWILANDPENVIVYCDRALVSERMSDIETALDCYQQAYELSRGNSQIRQEFNTLSAKNGQQDFMFSRAGLARLYMRGDLLSQAILEWEAVLSVSPDRLDARVGLLETYWREGLYDEVQKLATQILEDIPNCLKALLLLAHATSTYNMQQAQELIHRAEALDPELIMAHELFSDLIASQPNDPFLTLLQKESVTLPAAPGGTPRTPIEQSSPANGSLNPALASDSLLNWSHLESWSELDTMAVPQQNSQLAQDSSDIATWSGSSNDIQDIDQWATLGQIAKVDPELESWQEVDEDYGPAIASGLPLQEQQSWDQAEQVPEADETWRTAVPDEAVAAWGTEAREEGNLEPPSPPAWLEMLTRGDRYSTEEAMPASPAPSPSSEQQEPSITPPTQHQQELEEPFVFALQDNDAEMGWPEWLKSLGAAPLQSELQVEPSIAEPEPTVPISAAEPAQTEEMPVESSMDEVVQFPQPLSQIEQEQLAALENLEADLYSPGFIPLEPGVLPTIAQEEPSLSSALAQFGNLAEPQTQPEEVSVPAPPPAMPAPIDESVQPLWSVASNEAVQSTTSSNTSSTAEPAFSNEAVPLTVPETSVQATPPAVSDAPEPVPAFVAEMSSEGISERTTHSGPLTNDMVETPSVTAYRADTSLENELEMTMRRPAIRLQSMQSRTTGQSASGRTISRGRAASGKQPNSNMNYKERLVRSYQYQLAGSYDDAMQEYRIIIRNAPELLGEVISNVRALLKLVPKYSLGYRVLGDAYMRQGEYLQAMEAYNKALTMAKKARGQV